MNEFAAVLNDNFFLKRLDKVRQAEFTGASWLADPHIAVCPWHWQADACFFHKMITNATSICFCFLSLLKSTKFEGQ